MYYGCVHELAHKALESIRRHDLLHAGERVGVAVSGGADSVALLRLLLELRRELGIVLSVVHFNHKLRGAESDTDEQFVAELARGHKLAFHLGQGNVAQHALESRVSVETAARELRYRFFAELMQPAHAEARANSRGRLSLQEGPERLREAGLNKIATGHTLDDQAETVVMRVMRGTGTTGLRGIQPRLEAGAGEVIRPLLSIRHRELEAYLKEVRQPWREDSTNQQTTYLRNRVRHTLLPLLEGEFNPAITSRLAELAEIARAEEDYWENEADGWLGTVVQLVPQGELVQIGNPSALNHDVAAPMSVMIDLGWLIHEPLAVQRRAIKAAGKSAGIALEFMHVEQILRTLLQEGGRREVAIPQGWRVVREPEALTFLPPSREQECSVAYEYPVPLPGRAVVPELGVAMEAVQLVPGCDAAGYNPEHLFDPALLSKELVVRNWRPGDRFWPAHTKSPKKVKELLQERHIGPRERRLWPVVVSGSEIIWMRGFPGRAHLRPRGEEGSILIREVPTREEELDQR